MRAVDVIAEKRDGSILSKEEIDFFVQGFTRGDIPDYQASAWLMAVVLNGMTRQETIDLTMAMAHSGRMLDLSDVAPLVVDKHSTGGVGDKTTLVVAPIAAAAGLPVGKMSGRGLAFSGGTLDKLESIPGFRADLDVATFKANLAHYGIVVSGQTVDLAPADGKLYALRDVTATVESIPLIASSVMSKKIAAGANVIVLDVKVGRGAFMKTLPEAITLAETMVDIGQSSGRRVVAVLSDMNQPLGHAVGNALEVSEALDTLHARGPIDFQEHCLLIVAQIIALGGKAENVDQARLIAEDLLRSGRALDKFRLLIRGQGGDERVIDQPERLPRARIIRDVPSPRTGYVAAVDAYEIGMNAVLLGAGRAKKGEPIDPAVGIVLRKKIGSRAEKGEPLFTIHASDETRFAVAEKQLLAAFAWSDEPTTAPPLVYRTIL